MSKCCSLSIIPFEGESSTVITYTAEMRAKFGPVPTVEVYHAVMPPPMGFFVDDQPALVGIEKATVAISMDNPVTRISIDHGGVMSGMIRMSN